MSRSTIVRVGMALAFVVAVAGLTAYMSSPVNAIQSDYKGVICHATGSSTNPYNGIIVGLGTNPDGTPDGTFSNNGHLDATGSPLSGHENDIFLGPNPPYTKGDCNKLPPPKP